MLVTRTTRGIPLELVAKKLEAVRRLEAGGFVQRSGGRLILTDRGMEVQNAVVLELV